MDGKVDDLLLVVFEALRCLNSAAGVLRHSQLNVFDFRPKQEVILEKSTNQLDFKNLQI